IAQWTAWDSDKGVVAEDFGYETITLPNGRLRPALEELIRWRLWNRTGGGLMAELGSHQLDAASIFISAMSQEKVYPLSVHALGGRHTFPLDREAEDHVYCMFEFPAPGYDPKFDTGYKDIVSGYPKDGVPPYEDDKNKKIVVSYSSINGNGYGGYGEVVMGTKGTLVLEKEKEVMLFKNNTTAKVKTKDGDGGPTMDTQDSDDTAGPVAQAAEGPVSRGYTEEMEHWAYCIRNKDPENKPRCHPNVAMGDAIIALTSNVAIHNANSGKAGFVKFEKSWFDIDDPSTPDGSSVEEERKSLGA
ncbi:MAG: gfo/Idh/MocA family oxidoreductase, partial [Pirellulaceae bacterium]|nr:gfo/Idh/MocA family oxidoreductase [Pirellulaceae bacterium]